MNLFIENGNIIFTKNTGAVYLLKPDINLNFMGLTSHKDDLFAKMPYKEFRELATPTDEPLGEILKNN